MLEFFPDAFLNCPIRNGPIGTSINPTRSTSSAQGIGTVKSLGCIP